MTTQQSDQLESNLPREIGQPARQALVAAGYVRLEQLTALSEAQLKQMHGVGPKAIERLRRALETQGLSFADGKR